MFSNITLIVAANKLVDEIYRDTKHDIFQSQSRDEAMHYLAYGKGYLDAIYNIVEPYLLNSEQVSLFYQISHYKADLICEFEKYFKPII